MRAARVLAAGSAVLALLGVPGTGAMASGATNLPCTAPPISGVTQEPVGLFTVVGILSRNPEILPISAGPQEVYPPFSNVPLPYVPGVTPPGGTTNDYEGDVVWDAPVIFHMGSNGGGADLLIQSGSSTTELRGGMDLSLQGFIGHYAFHKITRTCANGLNQQVYVMSMHGWETPTTVTATGLNPFGYGYATAAMVQVSANAGN